MKAVFAFIALSGLCFSATYAIKCYSCTGTECKDPFDKNNIGTMDCTACLKVRGEVGGEQNVLRGCVNSIYSSQVDTNSCKAIKVSGIGEVEACLCDTELCNHGNSIEMNLTKTIMLGVFVLILKYFSM